MNAISSSHAGQSKSYAIFRPSGEYWNPQTKMFLGYEVSKYYEMVGIDGVYNLNRGLKPPAHFATQITLFLYCCLLHRMFEYQRLNNIAT